MRSDYKPAETFCCVCGLVIKDHQIGGNLTGTAIDMTEEGKIHIKPFDAWLCREHMTVIRDHIEQGLPAARRRSERIENHDGH